MAYKTLSPAASEVFRKHLRELRGESSLSLRQVEEILDCCRKTACSLLHASSSGRVNRRIADNLTRHLGLKDGAPWDTLRSTSHGARAILAALTKSDKPAQRRRIAWRLAVFISELAITSYGLVASASVRTTTTGAPDEVVVFMTPPRTRMTCKLTLRFNATTPDKIRALFVDPLDNQTFDGELTAQLIPRFLAKTRSWQQAQI